MQPFPKFLGGLSLDTDIYVTGKFGELDVGVGIPVVDSDSLSLSFLPMVGIGFDAAGEDEEGNSITVAMVIFSDRTTIIHLSHCRFHLF